MTPFIRQSFERLQRQKETVFSGISTWSVERLQFRPEPASWSTLDVLDHLVKVEKGFLDAVQENLPECRPVTFRDRLGALMVICVMQSPIRVKVPASVAQVLPEKAMNLSMITEQWQATREEMAQILTGLLPKQLRCGLFRHPVSGWMTTRQGMTFLLV